MGSYTGSMEDQSRDHILRPIIEYFRRQWLQDTDLALWNMYLVSFLNEKSVRHYIFLKVPRRSNNNLEGWHNGFKRRLSNQFLYDLLCCTIVISCIVLNPSSIIVCIHVIVCQIKVYLRS